MPETPSTRHTVFISYSHADRRYLDELLLHLEPLRREGNVRVWVDTMLKAGDDWREEIASALASARVAIMLVSAAFRASKFIAENELPPLLAAAKKEGLLILPVFVGACDFHASELAGVQAVNDPERPLAPMPKPRREMEWVKVARRVRDVFPARQRQKQMDAPINSAPELDSAQAHVPTPILGESVDDLIRLGGELWSQGTFGQALMALERALELDPDNAEAWYWKAITLDHLGNDAQAQAAFVQAARKYNQALALDPNDAWAWMGKGGDLLHLKLYPEALAAYERALELAPTNADAWEFKAWVLEELGRDEEAEAANKRVCELRGTTAVSPLELPVITPVEAVAPAQEPATATASPLVPAHVGRVPPALTIEEQVRYIVGMSRGNSLLNTGGYAEALDAYDQALALDPNSAQAWYGKSEALRELGRNDEAEAALERATELWEKD